MPTKIKNQLTNEIITLRPHQVRLLASKKRWKCGVLGRRSGKTTTGVLAAMTTANNTPNAVIWHVMPTYKQAHRDIWPIYKEYVPITRARFREGDLTIHWNNGSIITLVGREDLDSLKGGKCHRIIYDEFDTEWKWSKRVWEEALSARLMDTKGDAFFLSTPKGLGWAYEIINNNDPEWEKAYLTTLEAGVVPAEEVELRRHTLDPRTFRQEYEASFESLTGRVYYAYDPAINDVLSIEPPRAGERIWIGMDFNKSPMSAVVAVSRNNNIFIVAGIEIMESNTVEMCGEINSRYPNNPKTCFPDPAGAYGTTRSTDHDIIRQHGWIVEAPAAAPKVEDRINNTNANLQAADGTPTVYLGPNTSALKKALLGHTYKEDTSIPKKDGFEHITDALGYLLWEMSNKFIEPSFATNLKVY